MNFINNILCVTNLSDSNTSSEVISLVFSHKIKCRLHFLLCVDLPDDVNRIDEFCESKLTQLKNKIENLKKQKNIKFDYEFEYHIYTENEVTATVNFFENSKLKFDLIVASKHPANFIEKIFIDDTALDIVHKIQSSVLVVPEDWNDLNFEPQKVLIGTNLTEKMDVEYYGCELGKKLDVDIELVHAFTPEVTQMAFTHMFPIDYVPAQAQIEAIENLKKDQIKKMSDLVTHLKNQSSYNRISGCVEVGAPHIVFNELIQSEQRDFIFVIGQRSSSSVKRFFLGSHADDFEKSFNCPLIIVK